MREIFAILVAIIIIAIALSPILLIFYLIRQKIIKKNYNKINDSKSVENSIPNKDFNNQTYKYMFMEDYRMWKGLTKEKQQIILNDLEVIFEHGKDGIKKEIVKKGFLPGTKIIDVKYFSGLTEHGFTIIGFLLQHEEGGEIRDVTMEINLAKMEFVIKRNSYFSSGKEPYYYLKKGNSIIKK